jgi:hypothetical protein
MTTVKNPEHLAQMSMLTAHSNPLIQKIRPDVQGHIGLGCVEVRFKSSSTPHASASTRRKLRNSSPFDR